jgi:hypothetical protein
MPQKCKACVHPKRDEINRQLLKQDLTLAQVGERYGLTSSGLDRHKANHLKVSAGLVSEARNAMTIVGYANDLYERANGILARAEQLLAGSDSDARSVQAAAASLREVRGSIELLARLVVTAPPEIEPQANSWLDDALTQAVQGLVMAELPPGEAAPGQVVGTVALPAPSETLVTDALIVEADD